MYIYPKTYSGCLPIKHHFNHPHQTLHCPLYQTNLVGTTAVTAVTKKPLHTRLSYTVIALFCDSHVIITWKSVTLRWLGVGTVDVSNTVRLRVGFRVRVCCHVCCHLCRRRIVTEPSYSIVKCRSVPQDRVRRNVTVLTACSISNFFRDKDFHPNYPHLSLFRHPVHSTASIIPCTLALDLLVDRIMRFVLY